MQSLLSSLPQGLYWYPVILGLLIYAAIVVVRSIQPQSGVRVRTPRTETGAGFTSLIARARADRFSELELERLCLSFLLQVSGFPGYSTENCRAYMHDIRDVDLILAIQEHLGDAPLTRRNPVAGADERIAPLPPRCQLFVQSLQRIVEDTHEHRVI
jgi:hypothetical protein